MGRMNIEDPKIYDPFIQKGYRLQSFDWVPAATDVIDQNFPPLIFANPGGAANVKMPTSSPANKGLCFIVVNISGSTITFQTDGGAAFTTAITVATTKAIMLICTGSTTQAVGWRGFAGA